MQQDICVSSDFFKPTNSHPVYGRLQVTILLIICAVRRAALRLRAVRQPHDDHNRARRHQRRRPHALRLDATTAGDGKAARATRTQEHRGRRAAIRVHPASTASTAARALASPAQTLRIATTTLRRTKRRRPRCMQGVPGEDHVAVGRGASSRVHGGVCARRRRRQACVCPAGSALNDEGTRCELRPQVIQERHRRSALHNASETIV